MSEKAVGADWKLNNGKYTLRHSAGATQIEV